jgi:hypothetical protein
MKELRSFRDVIENRFYNFIEKAVAEYVSDNLDRLDLRSYHVRDADSVELAELTIKRVDVSDAAGTAIRFDVITEAELVVSQRYHSDVETDDASEWFRVSCQADLDGGLRNFEIIAVNVYTSSKRGSDSLTDDLVPVIAKEQFDSIAEAFLRDCGFGEAINTPMPIPVREVAAKMGLTIKETRLSRYFTIFGEIVFGDCDIEVYDREARAYKPLPVGRGTILVDPDVYFMRCLGCWNNTVIHECVHWYKHKKYHELAGMYDVDAIRISCQVEERSRGRKKEWTPSDWMEWQANGIAPRILMPRPATTKKIEELIAKNEILYGKEDRLSVMEGVLAELTDFYGVSRLAAKLRMLDLGYSEVEGIMVYMDDHYISNYAFAADSKNRDQTFSISLSDSFFEYFSNVDFRRQIDSGNFIYVDGHYVIDDPKYVMRTVLGGLDLTDYAKLHVDECCLRFDLKYNTSAQNDIVVYLDSITYRKATPNYNRVPEFNSDNHNEAVFARSEELKKFREEYAEELAFFTKPTLNFAQTAWAHIERLGLSRQEFCEKTLLSEKTYERIRNNNLRDPKLQTVMQFAVGLSLGGPLGEQLLELAGYKLNNSQLAYKKILYSYRGHSIYECDEVLTALGLQSILPKQYREAL